ncbi:hypothetical protein GGR39_003354 [Novosphingobium fluoreni]|uniref:Uncharacterized protein n=1 Tax=Novosphingobium fluoreni TaxID=1391222 RepID=A0A7W6FZS2_9SPHN|nr:hypothetical protein [Novosphingobium fluoreni]
MMCDCYLAQLEAGAARYEMCKPVSPLPRPRTSC